jgi:hypothetical protein
LVYHCLVTLAQPTLGLGARREFEQSKLSAWDMGLKNGGGQIRVNMCEKKVKEGEERLCLCVLLL